MHYICSTQFNHSKTHNLKVYYHGQKKHNPLHIFTNTSLKLQFNIILPFQPRTSKWVLKTSNQTYILISSVPQSCYTSHLPDHILVKPPEKISPPQFGVIFFQRSHTTHNHTWKSAGVDPFSMVVHRFNYGTLATGSGTILQIPNTVTVMSCLSLGIC